MFVPHFKLNKQKKISKCFMFTCKSVWYFHSRRRKIMLISNFVTFYEIFMSILLTLVLHSFILRFYWCYGIWGFFSLPSLAPSHLKGANYKKGGIWERCLLHNSGQGYLSKNIWFVGSSSCRSHLYLKRETRDVSQRLFVCDNDDAKR